MKAFIKVCSLILLFSSISSASFAQNWTSLKDATYPRWLPSGKIYGDKFYVLSGFHSVGNKHETIAPYFEVYDILTDSWSDLTPMPISKYESDPLERGVTHTATVLLDGKIWVIGGRTGTHPGPITEEVFIYDIATDTWAAGPDLPIPISGGAVVNVGRTFHYVGGFFNACSGMSLDHFTLDVDAYLASPETVSWENYRKPLPRTKAHVSVVALAGKIYAFGGENGHDCCPGGPVCRQDLAEVDVYDIETDTWSIYPDLPYPRSHTELSSFALDGKVYQVGSEVHATVSKTTLAYDPVVGTWAEVPEWEYPEFIMMPAVGVYRDRLIISHGGYPARADARNYTRETRITRTPTYELGWSKDTLDYFVYEGLASSQDALLYTLSGSIEAFISTETATPWLTAPASLPELSMTGRRIPVEVNSTGLTAGTYYSKLIVQGEGPDVVDPLQTVTFTPDTVVIKLTVGPSPDGIIVLSQPEICEKVEVGLSHTFPVRVNTPGGIAVSLTGASVSNSVHFSVNNPIPNAIPAKGEDDILVTFTPDAPGPFNTTFTLTHSGDGGSTDVMLACSAIPLCIVPENWNDTTLGMPDIEGSACASGDTYQITAAGKDIYGRNDEGTFLNTRVSGDGEIIMKVNSLTNEDGDTKVGIMLRESLDDDAKNAFVCINPNNNLSLQYRTETGGKTSKASVKGYYAPHWLRLVRQGNIFSGYQSEDGVSWVLLARDGNPATIEMPDTAFLGIALTSHDKNQLSHSEVQFVSHTFNQAIFPVVLESFTAELVEGIVRLQWKATAEVNFSHYEVERLSENGTFGQVSAFTPVSVIAAEGRSIYRTWDSKPEEGSNIYRLAMYDIDGTVAYSDQVAVLVGSKEIFNVHKLHGIQSLQLTWHESTTAAKIRLLDISGREIWVQEKTLRGGTSNLIPIPGLSSGFYMVEVTWGSRTKAVMMSLD